MTVTVVRAEKLGRTKASDEAEESPLYFSRNATFGGILSGHSSVEWLINE